MLHSRPEATIPYDETFQDAVEEAIAEVEARTSAELVLVMAPRTETYKDLAQSVAATLAFLYLAGAMYSPWVLAEHWVLLETALVYLAFSWGARRQPWLLRLLASRARQERAVARAAAAAFREESMTGTRDRTGILVFHAHLEDRLVILPDAGVLRAVPEARFHEVEAGYRDGAGPATHRVLEALRALGPLLSDPLPRAEDDEDELSNRPRLREERL